MREKLERATTLYERNEAPVVTVFNKVDRLAPGELADKRAALGCRARSRRRFGKKRARRRRGSSATASRRSYRTGGARAARLPPPTTR